MRKKIACLFIILSILTLLTACGPAATHTTGKPSIVCTIFPSYDWMREILGDRINDVDLTLLANNGVDLHSYQPTADDIIRISTCDMLIYVGGTSDAWVEDALKTTSRTDMIVIKLMDVLGSAIKEEELQEGMEHDHDEEHGELDEHVWLSIKHAKTLCTHMASKLMEMDASNRSVYEQNTNAYTEKLSELDEQYHIATTQGTQHTLLFADRFPFRYLVDDYGLDYYAAFAGCSAETEASFETIVFLAHKVDELNLGKIMVVETSDQSIAQTVRQNTNAKDQEILVMDSMQSVNQQAMDHGITYLSIMQENLKVFVEAVK